MTEGLIQAIEDHGVLTDDQIRELIADEAGQLGLSFDEAVRRAWEGSLPKTPIGSDVEMLVRLLEA